MFWTKILLVTSFLTTYSPSVRGFTRNPPTASRRCRTQGAYGNKDQTFDTSGLPFQDRVVISPNLNESISAVWLEDADRRAREDVDLLLTRARSDVGRLKDEFGELGSSGYWDNVGDNVEQRVRDDVEYLLELDRVARGDVVDNVLQSMDKPIKVADDPLSISIGRFIVAIREFVAWLFWQIGKNARGDIQGDDLVGELKLRLSQGFTIMDGSAGTAILEDLQASKLSPLSTEEDENDLDWGNIYFDAEQSSGNRDSSTMTQAARTTSAAPTTTTVSFSSKFVELSDFYDCFVEEADRSDYQLVDTVIAGRWRTRQRQHDSEGDSEDGDDVISGRATDIYFEGSVPS